MTKFVAKGGAVDNVTVDLVEAERLAAEKRERVRIQNSERQARFRARKAEEGKQAVTVMLSAEVVEFLNKYVQFKDMSKDHAIETAIRGALMRKR